MEHEYIIQHLTFNENESYILDNENYKEIYQHFNNNKNEGFHLLTYSNYHENLYSEFYILMGDLQGIEADKIQGKMRIKYAKNVIVFNIVMNGETIPIKFKLTDEQTSFELSNLLRQKKVYVHLLTRKMQGFHNEYTFCLSLDEKQKTIIADYIELFLNNYNIVEHKEMITLEDMMLNNNISYIKVPIYREDMEKMNLSKYEQMLSVLYPNVLITHDLCEKVDFIVYGYEDDHREYWQIPEIRRFIKALNDKFSFWFYFLDKKTDALYWITMCLCAKHFAEEDRYRNSMDSILFSSFLNDQLANLNTILYYLNDYTMEKEITHRIFKYYGI